MVLVDSFGVDMNSDEVVDYLSAEDEETHPDPAEDPKKGYVFDGGVIDVSSVHAVKGETHTATLLLETFYYGYDMHRILPYLKGQAATGKEAKRIKESLKVALVSCSRPTHLLGAAIHADTIGYRNARMQLTDADVRTC